MSGYTPALTEADVDARIAAATAPLTARIDGLAARCEVLESKQNNLPADKLPETPRTPGQVLMVDANGNLAWRDAPTGSGAEFPESSGGMEGEHIRHFTLDHEAEIVEEDSDYGEARGEVEFAKKIAIFKQDNPQVCEMLNAGKAKEERKRWRANGDQGGPFRFRWTYDRTD